MIPEISVIIPTLNEEKNLPVLLHALACQTHKNFEVIISDCASTDQTVSLAKSFSTVLGPLYISSCKQKNAGAARNLGATRAKGKIIIFFDADVEPGIDFLEKVHIYMDMYHLDSMTVWNRAKSWSFTGRYIFFTMNSWLTALQFIKPVANGPCMIMTKKLFQKVGGFDETIVFGEDFDFMQRANKFHIRFKVFATPNLYVSTRRFEKEGLLRSLYKSARAVIHELILGPIRKPIFTYEMGGQYYK